MPVNYSIYPKSWKATSTRIRERSGGRCECAGECGLHHGRRCVEQNGTPAKWAKGKIMLTVAHLDHDAENENVSDDRLKAMCQRCHLRYDVKHHQVNARKTRIKKRGLQSLFE